MMRSMLFWMRTSSPSSSSFCTSAFPSGLSWWVEFKKVFLWKPWHVWRQQSGQSLPRQLFPFLSQLWRQCHSSPGIQNETCFWKKKKSHLVDLLACESATFRHANVARVVGERLCDIRPCSCEPGLKVKVKVEFKSESERWTSVWYPPLLVQTWWFKRGQSHIWSSMCI